VASISVIGFSKSLRWFLLWLFFLFSSYVIGPLWLANESDFKIRIFMVILVLFFRFLDLWLTYERSMVSDIVVSKFIVGFSGFWIFGVLWYDELTCERSMLSYLVMSKLITFFVRVSGFVGYFDEVNVLAISQLHLRVYNFDFGSEILPKCIFIDDLWWVGTHGFQFSVE
jgi:hypothetical protein